MWLQVRAAPGASVLLLSAARLGAHHRLPSRQLQAHWEPQDEEDGQGGGRLLLGNLVDVCLWIQKAALSTHSD
jgi:hypothetical protein